MVGVGLVAAGPIVYVHVADAGRGPPVFNSGSNGSDGALILETPGEILFDPMDVALFGRQLDVDGDGVYHFTEIRIGAGVTVRLSSVPLGTKPVVWLASGAVQIDGALNLDGEAGHASNDLQLLPALGGAGGYSGGVGQRRQNQQFPAEAGAGPGGGFADASITQQSGGGAGHVDGGANGYQSGLGGGPYGNDFLVPLLGGSGGGGSGLVAPKSCGGGGGGGAILIASSVSIGVSGSISASGGDGGALAGDMFLRFGGAGSGGAIRLVAPVINGSGTISAHGGDGLIAGGGYSLGSPGRIRLEAFRHEFTGRAEALWRRFWGDPPLTKPVFAFPGPALPPTPQPTVRVRRVAGVDLPANPIGDLATPDIAINSVSNASLEIDAANIPVGTKVTLNVYSDNGPGQVVESTPLAGTLEQSTATATLTLPPGVSRFHVQATWAPGG